MDGTLGLSLGLAGAFVTTRAMAGLLYGIRPTDAATYSGAAALLALLTTIARARARVAGDTRRSSRRAPRGTDPPHPI